MEKPLHEDQAFLDRLYERYDFLKDFPCEFRGMCVEDAASLGLLHSDEFLGAVLGYAVEHTKQQSLSRNHFPFLPEAINLKLDSYRLLTPVMPWPQPILGVAMSGGCREVTGVHRVPVALHKIGSAQLWFGKNAGFIFEAFLDGRVQSDKEFDSLMDQLWSVCKTYLIEQGVSEIYTVARDPLFKNDWYEGHLSRRGYQPISEGAIAWLRTLKKSLFVEEYQC
jgi:hypothetical protein